MGADQERNDHAARELGVFYDWLSTGIYSQTLQLDGFRQAELNIINPGFPDPGLGGSIPATNRYELAADRDMAYSQRLSAGIAHTISRRVSTTCSTATPTSIAALGPQPERAGRRRASRSPVCQLGAVVARRRGNRALRERVAEPQSRADAADGWPRGNGADNAGGGHMVMAGREMMVMMGGPGGAANASGPRWQWRRGLSASAFYNWGVSQQHRRSLLHPLLRRSRTGMGSGVIRSAPQRARIGRQYGAAQLDDAHAMSGTSASPLNIRTGTDDNADLVFNDRPVGVT